MEEGWDIDLSQLGPDDLKVLRRGFGPGGDIPRCKEVLGRLVVNRTAEGIGKMPLRELMRGLESINDRLDYIRGERGQGDWRYTHSV